MFAEERTLICSLMHDHCMKKFLGKCSGCSYAPLRRCDEVEKNCHGEVKIICIFKQKVFSFFTCLRKMHKRTISRTTGIL